MFRLLSHFTLMFPGNVPCTVSYFKEWAISSILAPGSLMATTCERQGKRAYKNLERTQTTCDMTYIQIFLNSRPKRAFSYSAKSVYPNGWQSVTFLFCNQWFTLALNKRIKNNLTSILLKTQSYYTFDQNYMTYVHDVLDGKLSHIFTHA